MKGYFLGLVYWINGQEFMLEECSQDNMPGEKAKWGRNKVEENQNLRVYKDGCLQVSVREESLGEGRAALVCEWENTGEKALCCQLEIRVKTDFPVGRYLIPGVSVNGNQWGRGKEPKDLSLDRKSVV